MLRELRLPSEPNTASLGSDPAFGGAAQDQMALELGEAAKDRQHRPAVWSGGVCPRITQRPEARPSSLRFHSFAVGLGSRNHPRSSLYWWLW
jgi:hypothetical protein